MTLSELAGADLPKTSLYAQTSTMVASIIAWLVVLARANAITVTVMTGVWLLTAATFGLAYRYLQLARGWATPGSIAATSDALILSDGAMLPEPISLQWPAVQAIELASSPDDRECLRLVRSPDLEPNVLILLRHPIEVRRARLPNGLVYQRVRNGLFTAVAVRLASDPAAVVPTWQACLSPDPTANR